MNSSPCEAQYLEWWGFSAEEEKRKMLVKLPETWLGNADILSFLEYCWDYGGRDFYSIRWGLFGFGCPAWMSLTVVLLYNFHFGVYG
jgi:hypothetical protein